MVGKLDAEAHRHSENAHRAEETRDKAIKGISADEHSIHQINCENCERQQCQVVDQLQLVGRVLLVLRVEALESRDQVGHNVLHVLNFDSNELFEALHFI